MTVPHRRPNAPDDPSAMAPRHRKGVAWLGICTTTLIMVMLVVFVLQNTHTVEITFLWMHGSAPLAALLLVGVVGAARIAQPRRLPRRRRDAAPP